MSSEDVPLDNNYIMFYFLLVASLMLTSNLQTPDHCYDFNVESGTTISDGCGSGGNAVIGKFMIFILDGGSSGTSTCSSGGCNLGAGGGIRLFTTGAFFSTEYTIAAWVMAADTANIYTPFTVQTSSFELVVQVYFMITSGLL